MSILVANEHRDLDKRKVVAPSRYEVVGYFIAAINILLSLFLFLPSTCQPGDWQPAGGGKKRANYQTGPRLRARRREVSIVVKRFVSPASCRFSSRSRHWQFEQRRSVDDGRGADSNLVLERGLHSREHNRLRRRMEGPNIHTRISASWQ